MIEYANSKLISVIEAYSRYWQWVKHEYPGDDTCFWMSFSTIFLYFQFQTATESTEISLVLWHHWLTTFPNLWTPLHAFIMYHLWTPQVHWIFFHRNNETAHPSLTLWTWWNYTRMTMTQCAQNLLFFRHRLRFKLPVLGCSRVAPGWRTVILEDWNKQHSGCTQRCSAF